MSTKKLPVMTVHQKGFTFYLSKLTASELIGLCSGLRASPYREPGLSQMGAETKGDVEEIVRALEESAFAQEVLAAQETSYDESEPFQRILDRARVRDIARYLREEDSILPNSVILAVREDVDAHFVQSTNELALSWDPDSTGEPFNIVDGQHRIEGVKALAQEYKGEFNNLEIAVTILVDMPFYAQAELFSVVNGRQKSVSRSRIYDLLGYLPLQSESLRRKAYLGEMAVHRFCHHAVRVLNTSTKSPWRDRIKMRGTGEGVVTQAALVDHMAGYMMPKKDRPDMRYLPILCSYFRDSDLVGLSRILVFYFVGISLAWSEQWATEESLQKCLFGKTNGIAVMLAVLHDMIMAVGGTQALDIDFVRTKWARVDPDIVNNPPPGGSKGYQAELIAKVLSSMFGAEYDSLIRAKANELRPKLREAGALF